MSDLEAAAESVYKAHLRFLMAFAEVPEEKLDWTPSELAKSAIQIAGHVAVSYWAFSTMLSGDFLPSNKELWLNRFAQEESIHIHRDSTRKLLEKSVSGLIDQIHELSDSVFEKDCTTPSGSMSLTDLLEYIPIHIHLHTGQIKYLQSCWMKKDFSDNF